MAENLQFNCALGRKKTMNVELTLTEVVMIIGVLEAVGTTGVMQTAFCGQCNQDAFAMHNRLVQMLDVATRRTYQEASQCA